MCSLVANHCLSFFGKMNGTPSLFLNEAVQTLFDVRITEIIVALIKKVHTYRVHEDMCHFMLVKDFTLKVLEIRTNKALVVIKTLPNVYCGRGRIMKGKLFPFHHHLWGTQFRPVCSNCYCMYVLITTLVLLTQRKYITKVSFS